MGIRSFIAGLFRGHAARVVRSPLLYILSPLLVGVCLAAGLSRLTIDSDPNLVWVPPASIVAAQKRYFDAAFDPFFRVNQVIFVLDDEGDAGSDGSWDAGSDGAWDAGRDGAWAAGAAHPAARALSPVLPPWTVAERAAANTSHPAGILRRDVMLAILALVQQLNGTSDSAGTTLDDVCYKPIAGKGCLIESPLDYFRSDPALIASLNDTTIQLAMDCKVIDGTANIPCLSSIGTPVMPEVVLGGIGCLHGPVAGYASSVCGGCGHSAKAVMVTLLLQNTPELADATARWEGEVFLPLVAALSLPGLRVSYMAERSIADQIAIVDEQNTWIVGVSYVAMFAYVVLALGKFPHPVATRAMLGLQGILIVALSVAAAIGLLSLAGWHITMIVTEVVPFLILALGVDNMFIVTKAFDVALAAERRRAARAGGGRVRVAAVDEAAIAAALGEALAEVGPTITAAAVSEVLAFGVGITTGIPALVQFCAVASLAVGVDYVLQITWFCAAISLDARRQASRRMDCAPWRVLDSPESWFAAAPEEDTGATIMADASDESPPDGELASGPGSLGQPPALSDVPFATRKGDATQSGASVALLSDDHLAGEGEGEREAGKSGESAAAQAGGWRHAAWGVVLRGGYVRRAIAQYYVPILLLPAVRVVLLTGYFAMLGTSLYGATQLQLGLEQQLVLPTGSYMKSYFDDQARLGEAGPPAYLVMQGVNMTHPETTATVAGIVDAVSALTRYIEPPFSSWVSDFDTWGSPATRTYIIGKLASGTIDCPVPLTPDNATHAVRVLQFLADVHIDSTCCQQNGYCGAQYATDVKFVWGLPRNTSVAGSPSPAPPPPGVLDDGGCDLSGGLIPQPLLEAALGGRAGGVFAARARGEAGVRLGPQALARLPAPHRAALLSALGARAGAPAPPVSLVPCHVMASRLRVQLTPLRNQSDFVASMEHTQAAVAQLQGALPLASLAAMGLSEGPLAPGAPGAFSDNDHTQWLPPVADSGAAFMYSLTFVYYDQYRTIRGTAMTLIAVAVGTVLGAGLIVTHFAVAISTAIVVLSIVLNLVGFVWLLNPTTPDPYGAGPWGVDINAVSVVNLAMAAGLSVEFCVHVASAFTYARGSREQRIAVAMESMGASVFTGITVTKFVGVLVLAWAPSQLFRLYYFRMYLGLILLGALHGLAVLPAALSLWGWPTELEEEGEEGKEQVQG